MRTRIRISLRYPGSVALALLLGILPPATAQSNNPKSQQIYLPDPTPRDPDPRTIYGDHPEAQARAQELAARQNAKRRQLVEWAANELVMLSQQLQADIAKHPSGASMAPEAANAEKIEKLAKNLNAAVRAQ